MTNTPNSNATIDVGFINPFITSTQHALETQAKTSVTPAKLRRRKDGEKLPCDIAGLITITSKVFTGSIALCFTTPVFLAIYKNMTGEQHPLITPEIQDAAGEILNIIYGNAKSELNENAEYRIQTAIPTVVRAGDQRLRAMSTGVAVVLPFESAAGPFHLLVWPKV